ncbi:MAG: ABC transporter substrate-binding protein [Bacteroidales bacterium]|nr:ABC transporter substrate-binding protein [Bacteroidales bacterium]
MIRGFYMRGFYYIFFLFSFLFVFCSCNQNAIKKPQGELIKNKYSQNFEIYKIRDGYILKVINHLNESVSDTNDYLLSSNLQDANNDNTIIHIPVQKVVCLSTTHCAFISTLGRESTIRGISGCDFIYQNTIRTLISQNKISDIGYDNQLNYEKIISINPDVVFAYGIDKAVIATLQKIKDVGIPVIIINDYIESEPLGRTEWIKFFSCFYDKLEYGTQYFDSVELKYTSLITEISGITAEKPKVIVGLPWKGTWWVPGGNSFFANYIKDAGGKYIFDNNDNSESIPLSIEEVFSQAKDADIWLNPNSINYKSNISDIDTRLKDFEPLNNAEIYNNNKRTNISGGNDFWESGIVHPDIVLQDLYNIFYPDTNKNHNMFYYKRLY